MLRVTVVTRHSDGLLGPTAIGELIHEGLDVKGFIIERPQHRTFPPNEWISSCPCDHATAPWIVVSETPFRR